MNGSTAHVLADLAGAGLIVVGTLGIVLPGALAQSFGLPVDEQHALGFVRAAGVRDVALGAIVLTASLTAAVTVLFVAIAAGLLVSISDFVNAFYSGGRELHRQHLAHFGGAIVFAVILALLVSHGRT
jgi:hypothetical protein